MISTDDRMELTAYFDLRYKKSDDCDREMAQAISQHHELDKRLAIIEQGQKINNWLTLGIVGGIIALVIKVYLGG